jgi:hypothetical protein
MTFGEEWGWGSSVPESESIIARVLERGGNFIDTANGYTLGHSETIIGGYLVRPLPQVSHGSVRGVAAAREDRLHRPVLDTPL